MEQGQPSAIEAITPLLKIAKERQQLFFQLLSFVHKNIECSSNDLDTTTIFNQFLPPLKMAHLTLRNREQQLLQSLEEHLEGNGLVETASKEMLRLSSRVIELLEASLTRVCKGIFDEGGRSARDLTRFKVTLHKIMKREPFLLCDYASCVIGYTTAKFIRQLAKIQKYIEKVSQGEEISLRQLYAKASDAEASPEDKGQKPEKNRSLIKRTTVKLQIEGHGRMTEEKKSLKRPLKSSIKKREKQPSTRHRPKQESSDQQRPSKQQTANKLFGFYRMLEINRKQFLEDYIFKENEVERHRSQLLHKLLQRNKAINSQINNYVKKSCVHLPVPIIIMPPPNNRSSGDQHSQSLLSKPSQRAMFKITQRRGSFHDSSSITERPSNNQREPQASSAGKYNSQTRKSSHSNERPQKPQEKSRKLFVIKQPMVFEDEMIPQAQINQTQWLHAPHSLKRDRKHQNVRLKRKNNPSPLQNANFPQNFRYQI